jgi:cell division protein FtsX
VGEVKNKQSVRVPLTGTIHPSENAEKQQKENVRKRIMREEGVSSVIYSEEEDEREMEEREEIRLPEYSK